MVVGQGDSHNGFQLLKVLIRCTNVKKLVGQINSDKYCLAIWRPSLMMQIKLFLRDDLNMALAIHFYILLTIYYIL